MAVLKDVFRTWNEMRQAFRSIENIYIVSEILMIMF